MQRRTPDWCAFDEVDVDDIGRSSVRGHFSGDVLPSIQRDNRRDRNLTAHEALNRCAAIGLNLEVKILRDEITRRGYSKYVRRGTLGKAVARRIGVSQHEHRSATRFDIGDSR